MSLFLIDRKYFNITISFLLCFLFTISSEAQDVALVYNVSATKYFTLIEVNSKAFFKIEAIVYLKFNKILKNSFIAQVKSIDIVAKEEFGESVDVLSCKSSEGLKDSLKLPFIINYDSSGLLKELKVAKDEMKFSINVKLLLVSLLQVNKQKLTKKRPHFSADAKELFPYGICSVTYDIRRRGSLLPKKYSIEKNYITDSCTYVNQTFKDLYLTKVCTSAADKRRTWIAILDMDLSLILSLISYSKSLTLEFINLKPFKDSSDKLVGELTTDIRFAQVVTDDSQLEYSLDKVITKPSLTEVNKSIFKDTKNTGNEGYRNVYRALACDGFNLNIYMDLLERVILCKND